MFLWHFSLLVFFEYFKLKLNWTKSKEIRGWSRIPLQNEWYFSLVFIYCASEFNFRGYFVLFSTHFDTFYDDDIFMVDKMMRFPFSLFTFAFAGTPFTFRYFYPWCCQSFCHLEVSTNIFKSGETKSRLSEWSSQHHRRHHHHHHNRRLNSVVNAMPISINLYLCVWCARTRKY